MRHRYIGEDQVGGVARNRSEGCLPIERVADAIAFLVQQIDKQLHDGRVIVDDENRSRHGALLVVSKSTGASWTDAKTSAKRRPVVEGHVGKTTLGIMSMRHTAEQINDAF